MSTILRMLFLAFLIGLSVAPAQAKHDKPNVVPIGTPGLSVMDKQHILQDHFIIVRTVRAIPQSVLIHLLGQSPLGGMADAGQPYQRGDAVRNTALPFRRLVFAALTKDYCLVYNEYGGYAEGTTVSVYRLSAGQALLVWKATLTDFSGSLSLAQLQSEINKGRFLNDASEDHTPRPLQPAA